MMTKEQVKQSEWYEQWTLVRDDELSLFVDWIQPTTLEDFRGKTVLEGGCGGGQHTSFMAPYAKRVTAVDLNTVAIARERVKEFSNVDFLEADIATLKLAERFDVVLSIGVIHHTDDPDATVKNLIRHAKPGGRVVFWVYSREGNSLVEYVVEPLRKLFLRHLSRPALLALSKLVTAALCVPVYSLYRLPLHFLPYFAYFENFRRLTFERNVLNVFDKLNAPQVQLISRERAESWRSFGTFDSYVVTPYCGVSWRITGVLSAQPAASK
ncbi:MAG: class I SAM-dependent methyltransferase [Elusimicrobiota bacterium]